MNNLIHKLNWFLSSQLGLHLPTLYRSIRGIPKYIRDLYTYKKSSSETVELKPCLNDWCRESGDIRTEYFRQDLLVAQRIHRASPQRHCDVGSRLDGFIAHLASFREVEVWDIRPLKSDIPNISFRQIDIMQPELLNREPHLRESCDSLSCLHTLEHFGLGRYGDPISPEGWQAGLLNMAAVLAKEGTMYLSTPIGRPRVEFNANRVFCPRQLLMACSAAGLVAKSAAIINTDGGTEGLSEAALAEIDDLKLKDYALVIFILVKH